MNDTALHGDHVPHSDMTQPTTHFSVSRSEQGSPPFWAACSSTRTRSRVPAVGPSLAHAVHADHGPVLQCTAQSSVCESAEGQLAPPWEAAFVTERSRVFVALDRSHTDHALQSDSRQSTGFGVGTCVGATVGAGVGAAVGTAVGAAVGAVVGHGARANIGGQSAPPFRAGCAIARARMRSGKPPSQADHALHCVTAQSTVHVLFSARTQGRPPFLAVTIAFLVRERVPACEPETRQGLHSDHASVLQCTAQSFSSDSDTGQALPPKLGGVSTLRARSCTAVSGSHCDHTPHEPIMQSTAAGVGAGVGHGKLCTIAPHAPPPLTAACTSERVRC